MLPVTGITICLEQLRFISSPVPHLSLMQMKEKVVFKVAMRMSERVRLRRKQFVTLHILRWAHTVQSTWANSPTGCFLTDTPKQYQNENGYASYFSILVQLFFILVVFQKRGMSNDAAVVCQASVITLHILRWAQAVQSIWTKDSPYGTCGAHTRYVIWQAVSHPQKNDRNCQLP